MNKNIIPLMLSFVLMSTFAMPTLALGQPQFGSETISNVVYHGYDATERKWEGIYNSNLYTIKIINNDHRLYGWEIQKNRNEILSQRDFISDKATNPPLCSDETISYVNYKGQSIKVHTWSCVYDNDYYKINIYSKDSFLLGWQIFKNLQLVSMKSFI